jgi:hypothetical protein
MTSVRRSLLAGLALALPLAPSPAHADKIRNPTAVFSGLDKITGRIISFEVAIDETVQFGSLQLTPRVCYSRPETEAPRTTAFVEVIDVGLNNEPKPLFDGWVFASSPGLSAIDHAVYDVWLTACRGGTEIIPSDDDEPVAVAAPVEETPPAEGEPSAAAPTREPAQRRRDRPNQRFFPTNQRNVELGGADPDAGAPIQLGPGN